MLDILAETPHWLAINKPAGLIVERSPFETPTVEDLVWEYLEQQKRKPYLGIVHRLDRVTSGVLLLAKKKSTLRMFNQQFSERKVQKTYLALVENKPNKSKGNLEHWLEKDQKSKRAIIHHTKHPSAKKVRLSYQLIAEKETGYLLAIRPQTGKFHQIRVQLAAIGCPIVGDEKYGASFVKDRAIALHAWKLQFQDPHNEESVKLIANNYNF